MPRITPEQAREALANPPSDPKFREATDLYLTAIAEGRLPQYYLDKFIDKRNNYSDELPNEDVRLRIQHQQAMWLRTRQGPKPRIRQYKCEGGFIRILVGDLRGTIRNGVITDPILIEEINTFGNSDLNFQVGDPKNVERLACVNGVLDRVIGYLTPMVPIEQRP